MDTPLVTVRCLTYNHEPYIRQCLEGLVMQQTKFKFEAIVHDDASIDGTATIIAEFAEKYPEIIKPIYETENQYSKKDGSLSRIMDLNTRGKYVAFCDGDDCWIDSMKLQKQVDFLESNLDYGLVHTEIDHWYEQNDQTINKFNKSTNNIIPTGWVFDDLMNPQKYFIKLSTVLLRKELYDKRIGYLELKANNVLSIDLVVWLELSRYAKFGYLSDSTMLYRVLGESMSNFNSVDKSCQFLDSVLEIREYFADRCNVSSEVRSKISIAKCLNSFNRSLYKNERALAVSNFQQLRANNVKIGNKKLLRYYILKLFK